MQGGFIRLYRSLLDWEWYGDRNTTAVFIHLLLTANYQDSRWRGMTIGRGQRLCSRQQLARELHLSEKEIRTAMNHLQRTGETASQSTPQGTVITVVRYEEYQAGANEKANEGPAMGQPRANEGPTTNKEGKEGKEEKERNPLKGVKKEKGLPPGFEQFWAAYPKKKSKGQAERAWTKIQPDCELVAKILEGVARAKTSLVWTKDGGQFIPYPATWLNAKGWEDEDTIPPGTDPYAGGETL